MTTSPDALNIDLSAVFDTMSHQILLIGLELHFILRYSTTVVLAHFLGGDRIVYITMFYGKIITIGQRLTSPNPSWNHHHIAYTYPILLDLCLGGWDSGNGLHTLKKKETDRHATLTNTHKLCQYGIPSIVLQEAAVLQRVPTSHLTVTAPHSYLGNTIHLLYFSFLIYFCFLYNSYVVGTYLTKCKTNCTFLILFSSGGVGGLEELFPRYSSHLRSDGVFSPEATLLRESLDRERTSRKVNTQTLILI
jgi:hypothetical protein